MLNNYIDSVSSIIFVKRLFCGSVQYLRYVFITVG